MEFLTGVKEKETTGVREILSGDYVGKTVKMNGAVHNIRDMGEFAFIILRKAEGLVQCVYEAVSYTHLDVYKRQVHGYL